MLVARFFKRNPILPNGGVYMMCEIVDVVKKSYIFDVYSLESAFVVAIGGRKYPKPVRYSDVSNSRISEEELQAYLHEVKMCKSNPLTVVQIAKRQAKFKLITTRTISELEIKEKLNSSNVTVLSRESILKEIKMTQEEPDEGKRGDMVEKLQKQLQRLEREEELNKRAIEKASSRTVELNKRNRDANLKLDVVSGQRQREVEKELAAKGLSKSDIANPFDRKETVARSIWKTGKKNGDEDDQAAAAKTDKAAAGSTTNAFFFSPCYPSWLSLTFGI